MCCKRFRWWKLVLQDSQALSTIMQQLLHLLTASSAVLVQGDSFTGASKHADALKHLAIAWEGLRKLLPNGLAAVMQEADKKLICNACTAASATAASPKVTSSPHPDYIFYWRAQMLNHIAESSARKLPGLNGCLCSWNRTCDCCHPSFSSYHAWVICKAIINAQHISTISWIALLWFFT